jgi:Domain of Unknown Function (DUF930)
VQTSTTLPRPAAAAKSRAAPKLQEAKTLLLSPVATGDPLATTAMGDTPRSERVSQLCGNQLRGQLRQAWPPFFPEFLPTLPLERGNIVNRSNLNFRANGQWYQVTVRCEVDTDATKVVSFAFHVGDPVPRSEWQRLGLTAE